VAWSGLEVTGEDNPVDGWRTPDWLSVQKTQASPHVAMVGSAADPSEPFRLLG
jgi:hypothetical protein